MERLARRLGMDPGPFVFMYDTFELLANGREYYLGEWDPALAGRIDSSLRATLPCTPKDFMCSAIFSPYISRNGF